MQRFVNTFNKGIDKDTNVNKYSNENYQDAENIRLIVNEENGNGAVTNLQGISLSGYFVDETIVGTTTVEDHVAVFTKIGATGKIYYIPNSKLLGSTPATNFTSNLKVSRLFNFGDYIEVIARYQNSGTVKIWWVDGVNVLRSCNLLEKDINLKKLDYFDVYSDIEMQPVQFTGLTGGNLKSGSYQYVYALYSPNKAETAYTNSSTIIPITSSNVTSTRLFKGDVNGAISNKGISISITGALTANPNYSRIRIARLFYPSKDSVPEVDIVYEGQLSDSVIFNDTGSSLGTLVFEDVTKLPNIFIAKTLETKNDYLFAGNIDEEKFDIDIDMRMYQYPESSTSTKYYTSHTSTDGVEELTITPPIYSSISQEHNLLNLTNVLELDGVSDINNQNKYKYNSLILGGSGIYGEFEITKDLTDLYTIDDNIDTLNVSTSTDNIYFNSDKVCYQSDEIYRFGIVFYDNKGRNSFVKFIADARMPIVSPLLKGNILFGVRNYPKFKFNDVFRNYITTNYPDIVSFQIVRCDRTNDGTVLDTGYLSFLDRPSVNTFGEYSFSKIIKPNINYIVDLDLSLIYEKQSLFEFITPYSNYTVRSDKADKLYIYQNKTYPVGVPNLIEKIDTSGKQRGVYTQKCFVDAAYNNKLKKYITDITDELDYKHVDDPTRKIYFADAFIDCKIDTGNTFSVKGSTKLIKTKEELDLNPILHAYAIRRKILYPYGGYTYPARQNNTYISCTNILPIHINSIIKVYGGDTYMCNFEQLRGISHCKIPHWQNMFIANCIVETTLNLNYNTGKKFSYYDNGKLDRDTGVGTDTTSIQNLFYSDYVYTCLQEYLGAYPTAGTNQIFEQTEDFYGYNSAYSPIPAKKFFPKPLDFVEEYEYPTRIYRSDKKFNSEINDSWSEFKFNNFLDLDNTYGDLTKLILHNNNLIGLQPKAISIISVEPREMIPSEQGSALNVATGGVLDRYDYITNKSGSNFQRSVLSTMHGLYYYDGLNKKICKYGEGIEFISDTKGIQSTIGKANITEFYTLYHPIYKEVWFNYKDTTVKNITYNEYLQAFISRNSIQGEYWFNMNGKVYFLDNVIHNDGSIEANVGIIQLLDANNRRSYTTNVLGTFSDISVTTVNGNSSLTLIINPNNVLVNRFDILELTIDSINEAPVSSLQLNNSYLTSGIIALNDNNFIRRFRTYRFNQMRGITESDGTEPRFIDTHLKVKLNFTTTNDLIKFYDVITTFEPLKLNAIK